MLDEKDLQAIATLIDATLDPIQKRLGGIDERLDGIDERLGKLEENTEVTREVVNKILDWTDEVSQTTDFPLPKVQ